MSDEYYGIENEKDLIREYNKLRKKALSHKSIKASKYLKSLSDKELFVFIAGQTYKFGRNFDKCLENAEIHMENREKAIKCFSTSDKEFETIINTLQAVRERY